MQKSAKAFSGEIKKSEFGNQELKGKSNLVS